MSRLTRLFLIISILAGFSPLNLSAAAGHMFVNKYLHDLKVQSPAVYKDLISEPNFKSAFCGVFISKSQRNNQNGVNSYTNKTNFSPNLFTIRTLKAEPTLSKLRTSSNGKLGFQALSFDVLTPPPRTPR